MFVYFYTLRDIVEAVVFPSPRRQGKRDGVGAGVDAAKKIDEKIQARGVDEHD